MKLKDCSPGRLFVSSCGGFRSFCFVCVKTATLSFSFRSFLPNASVMSKRSQYRVPFLLILMIFRLPRSLSYCLRSTEYRMHEVFGPENRFREDMHPNSCPADLRLRPSPLFPPLVSGNRCVYLRLYVDPTIYKSDAQDQAISSLV